MQYFETDGYDSRMYAFENDVLYSYSIPVFFDKGYRYYVNVKYNLFRKLSLWSRFAQTIYSDKSAIGSGLDLIRGNVKTEVKLQVYIQFLDPHYLLLVFKFYKKVLCRFLTVLNV